MATLDQKLANLVRGGVHASPGRLWCAPGAGGLRGSRETHAAAKRMPRRTRCRTPCSWTGRRRPSSSWAACSSRCRRCRTPRSGECAEKRRATWRRAGMQAHADTTLLAQTIHACLHDSPFTQQTCHAHSAPCAHGPWRTRTQARPAQAAGRLPRRGAAAGALERAGLHRHCQGAAALARASTQRGAPCTPAGHPPDSAPSSWPPQILKKHHKHTGLLLRAPQLDDLLSQPFCSTEVRLLARNGLAQWRGRQLRRAAAPPLCGCPHVPTCTARPLLLPPRS